MALLDGFTGGFRPTEWVMGGLSVMTQRAQDYLDAVREAIRTLEADLDTAEEAITTAATERTALTQRTRNIECHQAYKTGLTITATDAGSDATVSLSSSTVYRGDETHALSSGSVDTLAYSTMYYVYVDLEDTPVYGVATAPGDLFSDNRVPLGKITTPASLAADTSGTVTNPEWV